LKAQNRRLDSIMSHDSFLLVTASQLKFCKVMRDPNQKGKSPGFCWAYIHTPEVFPLFECYIQEALQDFGAVAC
jgi:hypothetical protein